MGAAQRHHRRHRRRHRPRRDASACPIASPLSSRSRCRPGGSDISRCWAGRSTMPPPATAPPRSHRPWNGTRSAASCSGSRALPSLTTMAALLTLGTDAATIRRACDADCCASSARASVATGRHRTMDRCAGGDRAGAAAIVAMMTLTLNLWLAAKITATSGRLHAPWPDLKSTALPPMTLAALCVAIAFCFTGGLLAMLGADRQRGAADGLRADRLCRAAHADAGAAKPRAVAELQLRRRAWYSAGRCLRWWCSALPTPCSDFASAICNEDRRLCPRPEPFTSTQTRSASFKGEPTWKSFCWNASPSSARWAKSSASRTALPAIFCSSAARRCAPPRTTAPSSTA